MFKKCLKKSKLKILSIFLAILTLVSSIPTVSFAASIGGTTSVKQTGWVSGMYYDFTGYKTNVSDGAYGQYQKLQTGTGGEVYCVKLGTQFASTNNGNPQANNPNYTDQQHKYTTAAMLYGYQGTPKYGKSADIERAATGAVLWAIQLNSFNTDDEAFLKRAFITSGGKLGNCSSANAAAAKEVYYKIKEQVLEHFTIPSFATRDEDLSANRNIALKWDGSKYTASVTDNNGVLSGYDFSMSGVSFSKNGNTLTISTTRELDKAVAEGKRVRSKYMSNITDTGVGYIMQTKQATVCQVNNLDDPVNAFFSLTTESRGSAKIVKQAEDGKVEGLRFRITGNGIDEILTTKADGTITKSNLVPGTYTVTEVDTPNQYVQPQSQTVTVKPNETATVTFDNVLKRGSLKVTKTADDGFVEDMEFRLTGTSDCGTAVDMIAKTDSNGVAVFNNVLVGKGYKIEEVNTPDRYVIPDAQSVSIAWNETAGITFHNVIKKWNATVTKADKETGAAQGDASLSGAKYGIYNGEELIDTYVTDTNGEFTTKYYICGDNWSIRELEPSEGYLLDTTVYHIGAEAKNYTVEYNTTSNNVFETVLKGKIAITKHCDNGPHETGIPEEGAEFQVYLTSVGSYENAKESERDTLVADKFGYSESKLLPYGNYTVHQTKGWEGKEIMEDFEVFIDENGQVYRYVINNPALRSLVQIVKKDIETGKIVSTAGIGFKIRDLSTGNFVVQHVNYPTSTDIDTFYTDTTGKLMLPEALVYGKYELIEVQTANGYVLDSTPVPFTIDGEQKVVVVEKYNIAQKGIIRVSKTGEVFSSVVNSDGIYQPVYSIQGLPGAVFEVRAAEDIITLDGTVRYNKGTLVSTITTDENGKASTDLLYLGKYEVKEVKAPYGMVINSKPQILELTYAGQEVSTTDVAADFYNSKQQIKISLLKALEHDELYDIGTHDEILNVSFGLYAAEDIKAADGKYIPKGALLEVVSCDVNGNITFKTDVPVGAKLFVKEYSTDDHYILSNKTYPVEFNYAGQDVAIVEISVNNGTAIKNDIIRGSVIGNKIDDDGFEVAGALIGLFKADETEFTEETALMTCETNPIGVFAFEDVAYGSYLVREIAAPEGFNLNDTVYPVVIEENKQIINVEIEDKFITGSVQTTKVDEQYPDNKLSGAVFEVYVDVNGNEEFDADIDKLVGEMTEAEKGVYRMEGLRFNGYFLHEKTAPEGFLADDGYYYFKISTEGETVIVENEAGVGFTNKPIVGILELTKTDVATGKPLPNAGFRIKDMDGNVVAEGYTDENGIAKFELRYGKYTYEEFDAPDGYQIDEKPYEFEITENGEIVKAAMTNTPIPVTGNNTPVWQYVTIIAVAFGCVIGGVVLLAKKKKKLN